jgi:hypothetical protein
MAKVPNLKFQLLKVELITREKKTWDRKLFRIVLLNASPAADISGR